MGNQVEAIYDDIGAGYAVNRRAEPSWAAQIHAALGDARSVLNVGAGSGSYEPDGVDLVALEPSSTMIRQRPEGSAPVVQGVAERLPFADQCFDAAMAVLTTHHWRSPEAGFRELRRVAARQIVVTWDPEVFAGSFWLVRDYLPEVAHHERRLPTLEAAMAGLGECHVEPLMVPARCADGFFGAYWRHPRVYLDPAARASMSGLALLDPAVVDRAMAQLATDLDRGDWTQRNRVLIGRERLDLGYRLLVSRAR